MPAFGLLFGAVVWGLIWYPYRLLETAGISGIQSSLITYSVALLIGIALFGRQLRAEMTWSALPIALTAGWTNLAYVLAVLEGEVMRVLLLFYLSPLWTLLLARWLLAERPGPRGLLVVAMSLTGMLTMLWQGQGLPLPVNTAEFLALSAGLAFAVTNVLTRRAGALSLRVKSMAVWVGVCFFAGLFFMLEARPLPMQMLSNGQYWLMMLGMGGLLAATTWLVQMGVTRTPANRAAVIFMSELVIAAISSYWLANEVMAPREWLGGSLIILAALIPEKTSRACSH